MKKLQDDYMKVTTKTLFEDRTDAVYSGIWRSSKKRYKILNKPRRYKFTIHLINIIGDKEVITISPKDKLNKMQLSELIHYYLNKYLIDNEEMLIDRGASYLVIRINNDT